MGGKRVLVVDADTTAIGTLVEGLQQQGFEAQGLTRGTETVELCRAQPFELVLVGVATDGMKGIEVVEALLRYDPEALVVMMGRDATVETAVEALKTGAKEFVSWPMEIPELVSKLNGVLEQASQQAVRGNLRDMALTGIISVNCGEHNQAELTVQHQGREGAIYFDQGTIVHASLDGEVGEAVIYELLTWEEGSFSLRQGVPAPEHTVHGDWTGLLLEGMRRIDDAREDVELDLEWDEDAPVEEASLSKVARALQALEGVESVAISSPGGELLGGSSSADAARRASLTALAGQRALGLASALDAGRPGHAFVTGALGRLLVIPYGGDYVGLWLSARTLPESTLKSVKTVLRRYRRAKGE
jgi:DNA-binding response OmpR family regulator